MAIAHSALSMLSGTDKAKLNCRQAVCNMQEKDNQASTVCGLWV